MDHMIAMVEGARRQKTPNEIALSILLAVFTIIFLLATVTLLPFSIFSVATAGHGSAYYGNRISRVASMSYSDHDRRVTAGHRYRRHGQDDPG